MTGVWYAAIGAAFALGVLLVLVRTRRAAPRQRARHGADAPRPEDAELAALRESARADAERTRAAATADADAARRSARDELEAARAQADAALSQAREHAATVAAEARREAAGQVEELTADLQRQQAGYAARAARLDDAETRLDDRETRLAQRSADLQRHAADLATTREALDRRERELDDARANLRLVEAEQRRELERVAGLTSEDARAELLAGVENVAKRDAALLVRTIENEARAEGTERARAIVVEAVQRVAGAQTSEAVVSVLHLPGDDMKGRIIGREGRNIRSFEAVTGVNVIIDDTPEAVLLSCFDPVRREVGRLTLATLVSDGRIHPQRIEDAYEQSLVEVDELCLRAARDAVAEVAVGPVDERLLPTIGRLKYRTSYGQNVLAHLVETAHVAGVMAAELGIEPTLVRRCAFLHDIGKALTHEVEGSHAVVGAELLRRMGEDEAVAHAVEAHHNEVRPQTIEAVLTQAADTCSASRPGARRESLESYVKRLARIEEIARDREGVDKVFAMQAGREVRVMVQPGEVDDLESSVMAREIAKQIEDELTYPGQIRVTVVRESRATEIAH
ncbi:ribonucrease Y [Jatrophihabitans endophyticus]|uniref:Ribonuclease Y n=1 Tax=Jatrophihabitans endophyticus TaxID=1206085 RepID=A0A1M5LWY7_9ACTN|nr:ribonuclease Y [Jatrophihabitans endophyticus]SHG68893.1 ribonucrease Y [Jatrophihabitans endophyticus]